MKSIKIQLSVKEKIELLTDDECGRLFKTMVEYASSGVSMGPSGRESVLWDSLRVEIDRQRGNYEKQVRIASDARRSMASSRPGGHINKDVDSLSIGYRQTIDRNGRLTTNGKFTPPTAEEVEAYCNENGFWVDAEHFIDHYSANGWMVGKSKMKDWRATVRNWNRREQEKRREEAKHPERRNGYDVIMEMIRNGEFDD